MPEPITPEPNTATFLIRLLIRDFYSVLEVVSEDMFGIKHKGDNKSCLANFR
jgi:hypothetical protein